MNPIRYFVMAVLLALAVNQTARADEPFPWSSSVGQEPAGLPTFRIYTWDDVNILRKEVNHEIGVFTEEEGRANTTLKDEGVDCFWSPGKSVWYCSRDEKMDPPSDSPCLWGDNGSSYWPVDFYTDMDDQSEEYEWNTEIVERCYPDWAKAMMRPIETYSKVLDYVLADMVKAPRQSRENVRDNPEFLKRSMVVDGLVQINLASIAGPESQNLIDSFLKILENEQMTEALFVWALPAAKIAFGMLDKDDRATYIEILRHGEKYLKNYDHKKELAYLAKLQSGDCGREEVAWMQDSWWSEDCYAGGEWKADGFCSEDTPRMVRNGVELCYNWAPHRFVFTTETGRCEDCEQYFVRVTSDGRLDPYRKLEAFVFRRVRDGADKNVLLRLLTRVRVELE